MIGLLSLFLKVALAIQVPYLSGPVVDELGLLSGSEKQGVEQALSQLNRSGKVQMAILIAKDLQGEEIEPYAIAVADQWKLGQKGKDQGLIFIMAPNQRRMRLEVGRGLEGDIPDVIAKRILADDVAPFFKDGRYGDGLMMAVAQVGQKLGVELSDVPERPVVQRRRGGGGGRGILIVILLILYVIFSTLGGGRRRRGFWGGGGFGGGGGWGGGGGGFGRGGRFSRGGGAFSGGGSSSSW